MQKILIVLLSVWYCEYDELKVDSYKVGLSLGYVACSQLLYRHSARILRAKNYDAYQTLENNLKSCISLDFGMHLPCDLFLRHFS